MTGVYDDPRPAAPHPRIRQRRIEVRRDAGRKRLRLVAAVLAIPALAGATYGVTRSPLLAVDRVEVRGASHTPTDAAIAAAGLDRRPALTDLDLGALERAVETLPWVLDARATRHFPDRVELTIRERSPVAVVAAGDRGWALVDLSGRVLEVVAEQPPELATITTSGATPAAGRRTGAGARGALAVIDALPPVLAGRLPAIDVDDAGALTLSLDGKVPVRFGPAVEVEEKLVALATLLERADIRRVASIDVRVPSAPVLTRT